MQRSLEELPPVRKSARPILRRIAFYLPLALCIYSFFFGFPIRLRVRYRQELDHTPVLTPTSAHAARALRRMMANRAPLAKISLAVLRARLRGRRLSGPFGLRLIDDAVGTDRPHVLAMLIRRGAAINGVLESRFSPHRPPDRVSPLDDAVTLRRPRLAKMLLAAGAIPYEKCPTRGGSFTNPYEDSKAAGSKRIAAIFKPMAPTEERVSKYLKAEAAERAIPGLR